ncbi:hypothetical protein ACHAPJ_004663 [Fusarium lateritium]
MSSPAPAPAPLVEGTACEVKEDWDPRAPGVRLPQGLNPPLRVRRGDRVWVFRINQGYGFTRRPEGSSHVEGWVPLTVLTKGKKRVDPLPIELPAQFINFGQDASTSAPAANVLQETLRDLWRSVKSDENIIKAAIPGMSEQSKEIFFHRNAPAYADIVYKFIVPQAKAIMGGGNFTMNHLRTLPQVSDSYPQQPGIYVILYDDFGGIRSGGTVYNTAIYVGQTINFQARLTNHQSQMDVNNTSIHYRFATRANRMRMVPLLLQTDNTDVPNSFLDIAEFSMVCLLRSWYALLFVPNVPNAVGSYGIDYEGCLTFSRLMRQVQNRTNWNPSRTYGLNWNTPILKHPKADLNWTGWYDESLGMYVYRTRRNVFIRNGAATIHWFGEKYQVPLEVAQDARLENGQAIHLVVELYKTKDGEYRTHPFRFARFPPMIGKNPELEKLRSLAIQIQWIPKGRTEWKQYYLERSRLWLTLPSPNQSVLGLYRQGLVILCDVEKTVYTNGPNWLPHPSPAQVQFLRYNHLEQKLVAETVHHRSIPWPQDNTMQQNEQRLLALFPPNTNPDTIIGREPAPRWLPKQRKACDMCLSQRTTTKCIYNANDRSCQCCRPLNRPCTFSRAGDDVMDDFVHGKRLEELGIAVNISRNRGSMINTLDEPPFDPDIEAEEHGNLENLEEA